jgi:hypothetical protein
MFYRHTIYAVRLAFPGVVAKVHPEAKGAPHLMWMCNQIEYFDQTGPHALKAARWIGWMLKFVEDIESLGWTNSISRDLIRRDVEEGNDGLTTLQ